MWDYMSMNESSAYLSFRCGRTHEQELLLVGRVRGILGQLLEDIGAGAGGDVQVVGEGGAVGGGARERVLLARILW